MLDTDSVLLDVREPYRAQLHPAAGALNVPMGVLLAEPERAPRGVVVRVVSDRPEQIVFAVRYLREHGVDARPAQLR